MLNGSGRVARKGLRSRIFKLLSDGKCQAEVGRILEISRQRVSYHTTALVKQKVLEVHPATVNPKLYRRSQAADAYEAEQSVKKMDRVGRSGGPEKPGLAARVHRGGYKVQISGLDVVWETIPWDAAKGGQRGWIASGVRNGKMQYLAFGRSYRVWAAGSTLMVQPPEEHITDPATVEVVESRRLKMAGQVAKKWASEFGVKRVGSILPIQPTEFGFEVPGLQRFGVPGNDPVWVDESPGRPELETSTPEVAAEVLRLPERRREVDARLAKVGEDYSGLREEIELVKHHLTEQHGILADVVEIQKAQAAAGKLSTEAIARQVTTDYSPEVA